MGFKFEFPAFVSKTLPGKVWDKATETRPNLAVKKKKKNATTTTKIKKKKNRLESGTSNAISHQSLSISRQAPVPRLCSDRNSKLYRRFQLQRQWWFNFQRFLYKATYVTYLSHCTLPYVSQKRAMYHEDFTTRFFSSNCPLPASTSSRETKNFYVIMKMNIKYIHKTTLKLLPFKWLSLKKNCC